MRTSSALESASDFKLSIKNIVRAYKRQEPREYKLLCDAVAMQRRLLHDPKYARLEGSADHRGLYEISETLQGAIIEHMSVEGLTWFKTTEGGRWFASTFREFSLPRDI